MVCLESGKLKGRKKTKGLSSYFYGLPGKGQRVKWAERGGKGAIVSQKVNKNRKITYSTVFHYYISFLLPNRQFFFPLKHPI